MRVKKRKNTRSGQGTVEYILIIALLVGAVFMFGGKFKDGIAKVTDEMFGGVSGKLNGAFK